MKRLLLMVLMTEIVIILYPSILLYCMESTEMLECNAFIFHSLKGLMIGFVGTYAIRRLSPKRKRK